MSRTVLLLALGALWAAGHHAQEEPLGRAAGWSIDSSEEESWLEIPEGARAHEGPSRDLPAVSLPAGRLEVLERWEGWARVRHDGGEGWVETAASGSEMAAAASPGQEPAKRLERALGALPAEAKKHQAGPFDLYSDLRDEGLTGFFARVAEEAPRAYRESYGQRSAGGPAGAAVLFSKAEDLAAFSSGEGGAASFSAHASDGVAALSIEGQSRTGSARLLLHELCHLLNQQVFGRQLPPWLEEGLAEGLALSRIEPGGQIAVGPIDRRSFRQGRRVELHGALSQLSRLVEALDEAGRLPDLVGLARLDHEAFLASPDLPLLYALSALWVRYLLAGESRDAFLAFLARTAAGEGEPQIETLIQAMGNPGQLEAGFERWLGRLLRLVLEEAG